MNLATGTNIDDVEAEIEMIGEIVIETIAQSVRAGTGTWRIVMTLRTATEVPEMVEIEIVGAERRAQTETVAVIKIAHALVTVGAAKSHLDLAVSRTVNGTVSQNETAIVAVELHSAAIINLLRKPN